MLTDIMLGQYFPGNSILHLLDPRTKIISTILFISSIFLAENYQAYSILAAFIVSIIALAAIPPTMILRSLKPLWIIIILTLLIHIFTTPGSIIYKIGPLAATQEGVRQGLFMTIRLVFLIVVSSLLTFTTSPIALTDGIERLLNPFKKIGLPAHELAMMMTIALRFIPTLLEETDKIMKAQMARGADFTSGNILRRARNMIPLLVPLFISAFRRADELATAMEARCYRGGHQRTRMKELQITTRDWLAYGVLGIIIGILIAVRIYSK
ncbi:energy-coupling factor transporter transmembrane component T family protein [Pelosinus propionicus]|uniref:Energy-coupling factor transporter transmembrane protein EcfT n=1 Tax=Pelosinus propionicus DSM 13327 TaxID=1123291 RepID=A0A1I4LV78_9FIRM|nr:energy-coupling factor transporter transmembrane component T [Pelosinus propionicus]SFL94884.1 energy-coupling factor transport system permease protein [Pelosinus propionicus DSM 13327]